MAPSTSPNPRVLTLILESSESITGITWRCSHMLGEENRLGRFLPGGRPEDIAGEIPKLSISWRITFAKGLGIRNSTAIRSHVIPLAAWGTGPRKPRPTAAILLTPPVSHGAFEFEFPFFLLLPRISGDCVRAYCVLPRFETTTYTPESGLVGGIYPGGHRPKQHRLLKDIHFDHGVSVSRWYQA